MARADHRPEHRAEILRWPDDAARREELVARGVPRLLVMAPGQSAPAPLDRLEDLIWTPSDGSDVLSRLDALAARAARRDRATDLDEVSVTEDGHLIVGAEAVPLPPVEADLLRCLLQRPRGVRTRGEMAAAAWGSEARRRRSLDSRILTLRGRIADLGLVIHSVHGRGFLLESTTTP